MTHGRAKDSMAAFSRDPGFVPNSARLLQRARQRARKNRRKRDNKEKHGCGTVVFMVFVGLSIALGCSLWASTSRL